MAPNEHTDDFYVLTGGPGSGKSTLVQALVAAGHHGTIEAGRAIIQDQLQIEGVALPGRDTAAFAEMMLSWEMRSYRMALSLRGPVFFDRGVPDVVGYFNLMDMPVPGHVYRAAEQFRYNRRVFIAPPWAEIFEQDAERKQTPAESVRTYEAVAQSYADSGYRLIELPRISVAERVRFVLDAVGIAGGNSLAG